jgi:N-methylhydantoinase B
MSDKKEIDIITMHLINNFLYSLVDEMTAAVVRTSFSPLTRDAFDFQCGICHANGDIILEGEGSLLHSLAYKYIIEAIYKKFGANILPGDIFLDNDPYSEASHLPDVYLAKPIFLSGQLAAWTVSGGHMIDVGGRVAGSCACDSTEIYQEGLRIPPVKLFIEGKPNESVFDILKANSRVPEVLIGDLSAHKAACHTGEVRLKELIHEYGWETLSRYIDELLDYAERRTRDDLSALPDGRYEFTDYMDDDGFGSDPVPIHVAVIIRGDEITYDFTGTAAQIHGAMNNPLATTKAMILIGLRCLISTDIPRNSGVWRPVEVIVPPGTVLNPLPPAAVAGRGLTLSRLVDVIMGAEAQIAPDKIPACEQGSDFLVCMGFLEAGNIDSVLVETIWGGWGGRPFTDGIDYNTPILLDGACQSCESNEQVYPVRYNQFAFVPDTEGAGKFRGGLATVREWQIESDEAVLQMRTDRTKTQPWGLAGGHPGSFSRTSVVIDGKERLIGKETLRMGRGDILKLQVAGAGGWGNPMERDPNQVQDDVKNGKISVGRARTVYGVVIDPISHKIDWSQTESLRNQDRSPREETEALGQKKKGG